MNNDISLFAAYRFRNVFYISLFQSTKKEILPYKLNWHSIEHIVNHLIGKVVYRFIDYEK